MKENVPMSRRSGREAGGTSSSCSFQVTFTPKRSWVRHSTCTVESSQTGMETGVPKVFTCGDRYLLFRNTEQGASFVESMQDTKTGLCYYWWRSSGGCDCGVTGELDPGHWRLLAPSPVLGAYALPTAPTRTDPRMQCLASLDGNMA